ncbi:MAG TPA: hypothetical protein VIH90_04010 [Candidatus Saccharimonadales bacterium]
MGNNDPNKHVIHPSELIGTAPRGMARFNNALALKITNSVGTMWSAYLFALLAFVSLPATLSLVIPALKPHFPTWLISISLISLIAWVAQTFLQLVLLPIIMVGQNVIQGKQEAKAEADHKTLTYLANLQEEQMVELKNQAEILAVIKKHLSK